MPQRNSALREFAAQAARYSILSQDDAADLGHCIRAADGSTNPQVIADAKLARERLTLCNLRLVISIAKRYQGYGLEIEDLVQEGTRGLVRAVGLFDPGKGAFSTIATYWIKVAIRHALREAKLLHVPANLQDRISRWRKASRELERTLGRDATPDEIAAYLQLTPTQLSHLLLALRVCNQTLDHSGGGELVNDIVVCDEPGPDEQAAVNEQAQRVRDLLGVLSPAQRRTITLRYGLESHRQCTLEQVGTRLGVTRQRVQQIESDAMRRLRRAAKVRV